MSVLVELVVYQGLADIGAGVGEHDVDGAEVVVCLGEVVEDVRPGGYVCFNEVDTAG